MRITVINRKLLFLTFITLVILALSTCNRRDVSVSAPEKAPSIFEVPAQLQLGTEISSEKYSDLAASIDEYIQSRVKYDHFSGSVLVARDGEILLKKAYGLANVEHNIPNSPQSIFRLGSVTKQFTAMAILQLQEAGKLRVDDPISRYLPDYPNGDHITIHHLLTHSSGIAEHTDEHEFFDWAKQPHTPDEIIAWFKDKPLDFPPGTQVSYSNSGYILLGKIIEEVSGQTYEDYINERIFEPLNMSNSGYEHDEHESSNWTVGYHSLPGSSGGHAEKAKYLHMSIPYAAGALYSTVEELYIWDQALRTEVLVSRSALDSMFTPHLGGAGYGWFIDPSAGTLTIAEHGGGIFGYRSHILRYIEDEAVIIILSNLENAPVDRIAHTLKRMLFDPGIPLREFQVHTDAKSCQFLGRERMLIDDFESGEPANWCVHRSGVGAWFVYDDGQGPPDRSQTDPHVPFNVPDPPQGKFAAVTDMHGPGTRILYRDLELDDAYALRLTVFYVNGAGSFSSPDMLTHHTAEANQQYRIDLIDSSASIDSLAGAPIKLDKTGQPYTRSRV